MSAEKVYYGTGRRKTSAARVFIKPGKGEIKINGKTTKEYFPNATRQIAVLKPFKIAGNENFDCFITVKGGGSTGQAEAISHGISRALLRYDLELRPVLKKAGLLRRDPRAVERKKYGLHKARKKSQFSKR